MNNSQVARAWARQSKPRGSGSNFYFDGPLLFSYGRHFLAGKVYPDKGLALINSRHYSMSTGKHLSHAWSGANVAGLRAIRVPCPDAYHVTHEQNRMYFEAEIAAAIARAKRARKYSARIYEQADQLAKDANAYAAAFGLDWWPVWPVAEGERAAA
jgi:hypothetical protein